MIEVAIIGAGPLGGAVAHVLARRDLAATIRLVDDADQGRVAAGMTLDLMQSAPIHRFATMIVAGRDASEAAGAQVVVLADRVKGAEWQSDEGFALLKRVAYGRTAGVIVCAGASQRELVERGVRELGIDRRRIVGSAPEALAAAMRVMVALEVNGAPADVSLTVLGVPPDGVMVPWEDAAISGIAASRVLDEPARRRLAARCGALWPPGPYALANAAAVAVAAIAGRSRRRLSGFVAPDDSAGRRARAVALPVILDPTGVVSADVPSVNARDRVILDNAMLL
jgi:malate/lactate dehydrogenase